MGQSKDKEEKSILNVFWFIGYFCFKYLFKFNLIWHNTLLINDFHVIMYLQKLIISSWVTCTRKIW